MEELIPIFLFLTIAAVMILRPVTKKLGLLIEALARERMGSAGAAPQPRQLTEDQVLRVTSALDRLNSRLDLMDDRMSFMERLVEDRSPRQRLTGS